jgi:hypothetical protein
LALFSGFGRDPIDQNTGRGGLDIEEAWESLIGKERDRKRRIEGRRGRARLSENKSAAEKAKAERKSRRKEWEG